MNIILLQIKADTTAIKQSVLNNSTSNIWFWISIIELVIIILLIYKTNKSKSRLTFSDVNSEDLKKAKNADIDMDDLMASINTSRDLYKELSTQCHPDRFVNSPKQNIAEEIFQEISLHRRNHAKLIALKERASSELNITFQ